MKNLIKIILLCMICFQYSINAQNPVPIKNYNGSDNSGIRENVISQVGNSLYYTTFTYPNGSLYRLDAGDTEPVKWATFSFDDVDELQQFDDHVLVFILPDDNIKLYTDPNTYTQINFNTSLGGLTRTYPSDRGILVVPNENNYYFLSENNNQVYKLNYFIDVDFADIKEIHNIDDRYLYVQYSDLDNTRFVYDLQNDALIDVKEFLNEKYNVQVVDILFSVVIVLPVNNFTEGNPLSLKPITFPNEPFTYPFSLLFLTNITLAPIFNSNFSLANTEFFKVSTSFGFPLVFALYFLERLVSVVKCSALIVSTS